MNLRAHDVAVLRRVLWAAVYGEQHVPARRDRRHRRDMRRRGLIKLSGLASERLSTVTRSLAWIGRNTLPLFCMHLVVLDAAPWSVLITWCDAYAMTVWPIMLAVHVVRSGALTGVLHVLLGPVRRWFFPREKHNKVSQA